jgi:hypothetical protein
MAALDRTGGLNERAVRVASAVPEPREGLMGSTAMPAIPDVPMGYLMAAAVALCSVFFGGVLLSAAAREAKAMADAKRYAGRWVYHMAS